jgi:hypothetical protein
MKKGCLLIAGLVLISFVYVPLTEAGLIDYDRLNRREKPAAAAKRPAPRRSAKAVDNRPEWKKTTIWVNNREELRYDANRNRRLEISEIEDFLKYVMQQVRRRGSFYVMNSDVLKMYDTDNDGKIDRYESRKIDADLRG